jgi:protease PrsW
VQLSDQLILAGVLQTILYLFFVRAIDLLYEREPLPYVVAVFLWGFAVATTIAVFFNTLAS